MEEHELKIGQRVTWTSSSSSSTKTKTGTVVWLAIDHVESRDSVAKKAAYDATDNCSYSCMRYDCLFGDRRPNSGVLVKVERTGARGQALKAYYYGPRCKDLCLADS